MGRLVSVVLALLLAGCKPAQITLAVDPGFYPSAVAHDPVSGRFFVASYATGAIAMVRPDGSVVATVRPAAASHPVVQLAYQPRARRLWALTPQTVEVIELAALPVRRTVIAEAGASGRFADIVADGPARAFVLDAASGEIVAVDADQGSARLVARLPAPPERPAPLAEGALAVVPGGTALVAARAGGLWRVDLATGAVAPLALGAPLNDVSQLIVIASDATAHHVAALRGPANEIVTLRITPDVRRAMVDAGTRMRFDTPVHGTFDGAGVTVLLGRIRHHPSFGGDARPNLPPRLATYAPGAVPGDMRMAAGTELVR